ncbi:hypothetical protein ACPXCO_29515 [Streptomyces cyaneofuscatus]|uniref:hypothetical protein n=1 Tax=Streptomyces cyaneofuscatus TaxID=66883 RepID=UPI00363F92A3
MRKPALSAATLVVVFATVTACVSGSDQKNDRPKNATTATAGAPAQETFRRLAALEARTVCFGHGDPLTEDAAAVMREAAGVPAA